MDIISALRAEAAKKKEEAARASMKDADAVNDGGIDGSDLEPEASTSSKEPDS